MRPNQSLKKIKNLLLYIIHDQHLIILIRDYNCNNSLRLEISEAVVYFLIKTPKD